MVINAWGHTKVSVTLSFILSTVVILAIAVPVAFLDRLWIAQMNKASRWISEAMLGMANVR